jgi:hypothetical protein
MNCNTVQLDASLANVRKLVLLPMCRKSRTLMPTPAACMLKAPDIEKLDPKRLYCRTLRDDPQERKSITDAVEPLRIARTERLLAACTKSVIDNRAPNLPKLRRDKLEPKVRKSNTEQD